VSILFIGGMIMSNYKRPLTIGVDFDPQYKKIYTCLNTRCQKPFIDYINRHRKCCSHSCLMTYLNLTNPIFKKNRYSKLHFKISKRCKNYIDGLLLSDASIPRSKSNNHNLRLNQRFARRYKD